MRQITASESQDITLQQEVQQSSPRLSPFGLFDFGEKGSRRVSHVTLECWVRAGPSTFSLVFGYLSLNTILDLDDSFYRSEIPAALDFVQYVFRCCSTFSCLCSFSPNLVK